MKKFREKIKLENGKIAYLDNELLFVKLNSPESSKKRVALLKQNKLEEFRIKDEDNNRLTLNQKDNFFFIKTNVIDKEQLSKIENSFKDNIEYISPVYYINKEIKESYFTLVANSLVVKPKINKTDINLGKLLKKYSLEIVQSKSSYLSNSIYVTSSDKQADVYDIKNKLVRSRKYIEDVYFEKIPLIIPTCSLPNDPLFSIQWNLNRIQWHKDYNVCNNDVIVAVIDEGCDLNHPDLNFISAGINLGSMLPDGSPTGNHGTACAGIAIGITNNSEGVAGVSGKSKLLPLAVQTWSDVEIANGINYAATYGADVISMSFGVYDFWNFWNYALIDPEIVYAHNLGVFMCAATGNENYSTLNRYPSKNALVLAVGGSNKDDRRKSIGDTSSENWWGASYGLEQYQNSWTGVSVVSPCLEIPTTDRLGGLGYSPNDYYNRFNGTSSATPQVAGLAALLKAHFPSISNVDIRKVIEKSADKVGGYTYSFDTRFPNSSWNQEMGHGRINVRKALKLAKQLLGCCTNNCYSNNCCSDDKIAVSVKGTKHISRGVDQAVAFQSIITNEGGAWMNDEFVVPKKGLYYFDLNMVKDAFYHQGTTDDVSLYLKINNAQVYGSAWSGQSTGKRGTGTYSVILNLDKNDKVKVFVHSDGNYKRHVAQYSLSIHML